MDDSISRRAAIDALWKALYEYEDKTEKQFQESEDLDVGDWIEHRIFVQNMNDIDRQTILNLPSAQPQPRWIPVEERLPIEEFEEGIENGTVYDLYPCLVTRYSTHTDEPRTRTYVCKSYFDGEDFMLHGGYEPNEGSDTENTLAWMPLPKPYERSEDAES